MDPRKVNTYHYYKLLIMTKLNATHDPARRSWVESANQPGCDFPIQNLPFGVFSHGGQKRAGVAVGDRIVDLQAALDANLLDGDAAAAVRATAGGQLNGLMALEQRYVSALRAQLSDLLRTDSPKLSQARAAEGKILVAMADVKMELPCNIGDYTDFLTSKHHTERHGRFKGLKDPLPAAFKSLPVAYHGRASSIRVSGASVVRPNGQYKDAQGEVCFGPAPMLDFELEIGPKDPGVEDPHIRPSELLHYVFHHILRGGSRERQHSRIAQISPQQRQA